MSPQRFADKVVLVTGAAGGLGTALCHVFAAQGARIAAMDRDRERLDALVAGLPTGALAIAGDLTDPEAIGYGFLAPEHIADAIVHAIDQPWGVSISDITVRASGDHYIN